MPATCLAALRSSPNAPIWPGIWHWAGSFSSYLPLVLLPCKLYETIVPMYPVFLLTLPLCCSSVLSVSSELSGSLSLVARESYWRTPGQTVPAQLCCFLAVLSNSIASCSGFGDQLHLCRAFGTPLLLWVGGATLSLVLRKDAAVHYCKMEWRQNRKSQQMPHVLRSWATQLCPVQVLTLIA